MQYGLRPEWEENVTEEIKEMNNKFAKFFVNECRKSTHK